MCIYITIIKGFAAYSPLYIFKNSFTSSWGDFSTVPTSVSHLLQRQTCLFVCFTAAAHLACRQKWERRIENPSPVGICSPCSHLMSPKRLLPESHPKVKLRLSSINTFHNSTASQAQLGGFRSQSHRPVGPLNEMQQIYLFSVSPLQWKDFLDGINEKWRLSSATAYCCM